MENASPFTTRDATSPGIRPRDDELDMYGLSHVGRVRTENQDQFLLCTVHPQVVIHGTSLPDPNLLALRGQRLASILLVADGVGGSAAGSTASRLATEAVTRYVVSSVRSYEKAGSSRESEFLDALRSTAIAAHEAVLAESKAIPEARDMATTLCLGVVVWPWLYVVQVGDSRCYRYHAGHLEQVTRDQTVAQDLIERGVLSKEVAHRSPLKHVLSSAIGAPEALPELTKVDVRERGTVIMVCTDGLTKHIDDEEIAEHLGAMRSAEQVCRDLLQLALDRGGTDNITLVVGRARKLAHQP